MIRRLYPLSLGVVVVTPQALAALNEAEVEPGELLTRHAAGDWGDVNEDEAAMNDQAVREGFTVRSIYVLDTRAVLFVVTLPDRRRTTILRVDP